MAIANKNIIPLLKEIEIFTNFSDAAISELASKMVEVNLKKGDILFSKGDQEHAMYIIIDGSVQIHDNEYIFTTLNNKQFFGEYSLIDSSIRSASVTATRDSKLLELAQKSFSEITDNLPEIWQNILVSLIKRLRDYNILEEKLAQRTLQIQKSKYEVEQEKESIKQQKKDLESINSTKDKFFTIISHDLKVPFSTIVELSDKLKVNFDNLDPEDIRESVNKLNRFSKNAYNLLDKLLLWAQSQTGLMTINFKRNNLSDILNEVLELYQGAAQQKKITFIPKVNQNIFGYFDTDMITLVFRNIISNAIEHSKDKGTIYIDAMESKDMISIEVRDEGIGMNQQLLDSLFKIENRREMNPNEEHEGTGLGLIICKDFVLKNGGEIWAESNKNKGTTMKFSLPKAL